MGTRVVIYIHPDQHEQKQERAIIGFCAEHDFEILGAARTPESAAQAVAAGISHTVVAATDPRNGLRSMVGVAGGEMLFVRERSRTPTLRDFLGRAVQTGRTPSQIARLIGSETTDISELLHRLGLRKPDNRP